MTLIKKKREKEQSSEEKGIINTATLYISVLEFLNI